MLDNFVDEMMFVEGLVSETDLQVKLPSGPADAVNDNREDR